MKGTLTQIIDRLRLRKRQYQTAFGIEGSAGHEAFLDLARFTGAFSTTIHQNKDAVIFQAGMRAAFFRIWNHLHLEPAELAAVYRATVLPNQGDQE